MKSNDIKLTYPTVPGISSPKGPSEYRTSFSDMRETLPPKLLEVIEKMGCQGDRMGVRVFLVGGFVRDIFIGEPGYDIDLVVEGDALAFGRSVSEITKGSLVEHGKFGTCTIISPWPPGAGAPGERSRNLRIDIAGARKEKYSRPAALPEVMSSSLRKDLARRDFTINAMALGINGGRAGVLIDMFGGVDDICKKTIRVLHDKSFIDDPTRIFRAVKFEQRLGFKIEEQTEYLIKRAISRKMIDRAGGHRIRDELLLVLKEKNPERSVLRMNELNELRFIHPALVLKRGVGKAFNDFRKDLRWYQDKVRDAYPVDIMILYLMFILEPLSEEETDNTLKKFGFPRHYAACIRMCQRAKKGIMKKLSAGRNIPPSKIFSVLEGVPREVVLYCLSVTRSERIRKRIKDFLSVYDLVEISITGKTIREEGIPPGPRHARLLREILHEKLDGFIGTEKDELRFLRSLIGGNSGTRASGKVKKNKGIKWTG